MLKEAQQMVMNLSPYSKFPYIATASSTVISPFPTWNAARRSRTVSGSRMPSTSGDMILSDGTRPKGAQTESSNRSPVSVTRRFTEAISFNFFV